VRAAVLLCTAACASLPRPAALAGQWADLAHSTPADTSVWILEPSGRDLVVRIVADSAGRNAAPQPYGRWYVRGADGDSTRRALCITRRPGRDAPTCTRFALDTVMVYGHAVRRLRLLDYQGAHRRGERVLLERQPAGR
jgi:hypothetical protein